MRITITETDSIDRPCILAGVKGLRAVLTSAPARRTMPSVLIAPYEAEPAPTARVSYARCAGGAVK